MNDLVISYRGFGSITQKKYRTIMDFMDMVESGYPGIPSGVLLEARFFGNPLLDKTFNSVGELYRHCKEITK